MTHNGSRRPAPTSAPIIWTHATQGSLDGRLEVAGWTLTKTSHASNLALSRHAHRDPAITLVLAGEFQEVFHSGGLHCSAGGLLFKPAGQSHSNLYGRDGAKSLLIDATALAPHVSAAVGPLYHRPRYLAGGCANRAALRIAREMRVLDDTSLLAIEALLLELIVSALRAQRTMATTGRPPWLARAVEFLHANRDTSVRLDQLARACDIEPGRIAFAFRRSFGMSPGAYHRRLRCEWAADQLARTDRPIAQLALDAGFVDQSHFTRVFSTYAGSSPGAFRKGHRAKSLKER